MVGLLLLIVRLMKDMIIDHVTPGGGARLCFEMDTVCKQAGGWQGSKERVRMTAAGDEYSWGERFVVYAFSEQAGGMVGE